MNIVSPDSTNHLKCSLITGNDVFLVSSSSFSCISTTLNCLCFFLSLIFKIWTNCSFLSGICKHFLMTRQIIMSKHIQTLFLDFLGLHKNVSHACSTISYNTGCRSDPFVLFRQPSSLNLSWHVQICMCGGPHFWKSSPKVLHSLVWLCLGTHATPFIFQWTASLYPKRKSIKHRRYHFELSLHMLLKFEVIRTGIRKVIKSRNDIKFLETPCIFLFLVS